MLYGEGAQGLSDSRGLTLEEAEQTINKVMKAMPRIDRTNQLVQHFAKTTGFVETISGHVRRLPEAKSSDKRLQSRAVRQSFNAVVQGSASYCTNTALILIRKAFIRLGLRSKIAITVHDSVVVDMPKDEATKVPLLVKFIMEHLPIEEFIMETKDFPTLKIDPKYMINDHQFRFPLFAEIEFGKYYSDGLDFDKEKIDQIGLDKYYEYAMKCKYIEDKYNTQLASEEDNDKKKGIIDTMNTELDKIKEEYF